MRRAAHRRLFAAVLVWLLLWGADAFAVEPSASAAQFRITGVVLNSRSGAPVPFCRVSAEPANGPAPASPTVQRQNGGRGPLLGRGVRRGPGAGSPPALPGSETSLETKADVEGRFALDLPRAGSWRVVAAARGFRSQAYDEHEGFYSSIVLSEAVPAFEATFRITPDAIVSGLAIDEAGEPVANAQVVAEVLPAFAPGETRASPAARPRQVANAATDDRGRYELPPLPPGEYHIRVQAQPWYANGGRGGFRGGGGFLGAIAGGAGPNVPPSSTPSLDPSLDVLYPTIWYPAADSEDGAETISLAGGEERQVDFHLAAIPAAHLAVSRPELPLPDPADPRSRQQRPVTITRVSSDGSYGQTTFIGGNGRDWEFGGLAPGTYEVRLPNPNDDGEGETRQIEVRPGSSGVITMENSKPLSKVTIKLDGLRESRGSFVEFFDARTGRRIVASPPLNRRQRRSEDDEESGDDPSSEPMTVMLPPHTYQMSVSGGSGAYITGISAAGAKAVGSTVEIGDGPATLSLHLANARGQLSGFTRTGEQPVSGAMVLLVPVTLGEPGSVAPLLRDQTNSDGSFEFASVVPGRYILVAIDHGWRVDWRHPGTLAKYLSQGMPVELKGSARLREQIPAVQP